MAYSKTSSDRGVAVVAGQALALAVALAAVASGGCDDRSLDPGGGGPQGPPVMPLFVALTSDGSIVTSPDASSWTARSSGGAVLNAVAAGPSVLVAVGGNGAIVISRDGLTWRAAASPTTIHLSRVTFAGDRFVAVGGDWTLGAVTLTSADGETWATLPSPADHMFHGIAHNGGALVVAAYYRSDMQTPSLFHAPAAGGDWTKRQGPDFYDSVSAAGLMVVAGGRLSISADGGQSWETTLVEPRLTAIRAVAFGGATFLAAGERGYLYTSPDARAWTERQNPLGQLALSAAAHGGDRFVVVGPEGEVLVSEDGGVTFTARATGVAARLDAIAFGPAAN